MAQKKAIYGANWNYFTSGIHSDEEAKSDFLETIGFTNTQTATTG